MLSLLLSLRLGFAKESFFEYSIFFQGLFQHFLYFLYLSPISAYGAFQILYAKLQQIEDDKVLKEASDARLEQIGTGDRSERIRTYNFPQTRITDHRIGLTIHQLDQVMGGSFELLIDPLIANFQAEALKKQVSA